MELLHALKDRSVFRYGGIALVLAALLFVLMETDRPVRSHADEALRGDRQPDGFITQGTYRSYDEQGNLATRIHSPRAEQFNDDGLILMDSPSGVIFEQQSRLPWVITANVGHYLLDDDALKLSGEVEIERKAEDDTTARLLTEQLTLDNRQRIVHTDAAVTLLDARGETRAIGMKGQIDDRILEFDTQVRGVYRMN